MNIRLSIIIPTYNCVENLHSCIHSVVDQMTSECECIIVDDGSEPPFVNELKKLVMTKAFCNKNVKIECAVHNGPSEARNSGIGLAEGEYIAFLDGDDQMAPEFIENALKLLSNDADLYIFSIDAIKFGYGKTEIEKWVVEDRIYDSAAAFADEYVRNRHLLLYSQCNKLYRKKLIDEYGIIFDRNAEFGEDRLFNYEFLKRTSRIVTSEQVMFKYNIHEENRQKRCASLSGKHVSDYFDKALALHDKKMQCILSLAEKTSQTEKHRFIQYDLRREIENTINRFDLHPEETEQCIGKINEIIFGKERNIPGTADAVIVLGSRRCRYRIEKAFELFREQSEATFIVCGGSPYDDTDMTEADFMAGYLRERGVEHNRIVTENKSVNTLENLIIASQLLSNEEREIRTLAIVTGGFHIPRVEQIVAENNFFTGKTIYFIPAYGNNTGKDNWFRNPIGKDIILKEIENR